MAQVLLVEDELLIAAVVQEALEDEGLHVSVAHSGAEAVAALEHDPAQFAVLVTDINLGNHIDGFEVARRGRFLRPAIKIVYVTGKPSNVFAADDEALMFPKPFDVADLAATVRVLADEAASCT